MDIQAIIEDIKNIDPTEIRLDNIGRWPLIVRVLMCLGAFVAVIAVYFYFVISNSNSTLESTIAQEAELRETFESRSYEAANLEAYREQRVELDERLQTLIGQLPKDTEVPGLLEDITETGLSSGLAIESIQLQNEQSHDYYVELPISINASGGYHDFATFISGVSGLPRIVTLHDFEITKNGSSLLNLSITAKTYRYREPE
jgi:type IV pilus assembly protein PilO